MARICSDELAFVLDFAKPSSSAPMLAVVWLECPRTTTSEHSASAAEVPNAVVSSRNQSVKLKSADLRARLASASRQCRVQWIVVRCDSGARRPYITTWRKEWLCINLMPCLTDLSISKGMGSAYRKEPFSTDRELSQCERM